jgi:LPS sulfotransferase NodH
MQCTKHDLMYSDYAWTELRADDLKRTGRPDNVLFNRRDGQEVLAFLAHNFPDPADAQRAEWALRHQVPARLHSRREVHQWLTLNWAFVLNVWKAHPDRPVA